MKTVIHVDEPGKWDLALENARNIIKYGERTGVDFRIEIVANGDAACSLCEDRARAEERYDAIRDLALDTVKFVACQNALAARDIRESSLIPFVEVVPAGIVELIRRQEEGYAYLKP